MPAEDAVCVANIGPRERRKRLLAGAVVLAGTCGAAVALVLAGTKASWPRFLLFLPFLFGVLALAQARAGL